MVTQIICLGAAHIDNKAFGTNPIVWGSKNPVTLSTSLGGVARNVAENLRRLEIAVHLFSRVGCDQAGDLIIAHLAECGIDAKNVHRSSTQNTATFTALLEPDGTLAVAFSDMAIYDEMRFDYEQLRLFNTAPIWMVDANILEEELIKIASTCPAHVELWAVGTSVAKNPKFLSIMPRIDTLIVNLQESGIFTDRGVRRLVITAGEKGAYLIENGTCLKFSARPIEMVDSTGAGDAFAAGLAFGYLKERSLSRALPFALACADITIQTKATVCRTLSKELLLKHVANPLHRRS